MIEGYVTGKYQITIFFVNLVPYDGVDHWGKDKKILDHNLWGLSFSVIVKTTLNKLVLVSDGFESFDIF